MDIRMAGLDGIGATRQIAAAHPAIRVVGLSTYDEYAASAIDAGARAFVSKADFDAAHLIDLWRSTS